MIINLAYNKNLIYSNMGAAEGKLNAGIIEYIHE